MKVIGLTGGFKTGKSTVTRMLSELGVEVIIDADKLAHKALKLDSSTYKKIIKEFGEKFLDDEGRINRRKLAKLVFSNKEKLNLLNSIIHPYVIDKVKEKIYKTKQSSPNAIIIVDAPLLYEAGMQNMMDKIIVVSATKNKQIQRARQTTSLSEYEVKRRIENQLPLTEKEKLADVVIENNGTLEDTKSQVKKMWKRINEEDIGYGTKRT